MGTVRAVALREVNYEHEQSAIRHLASFFNTLSYGAL